MKEKNLDTNLGFLLTVLLLLPLIAAAEVADRAREYLLRRQRQRRRG